MALFPVPVPLPGFYSTSLTQFSSCVPASACPGVDVQRVTAALRNLMMGGVEELRQVGSRFGLRTSCVSQCVRCVILWDFVEVRPPSTVSRQLKEQNAIMQVDAMLQHFFAAATVSGQPGNSTTNISLVGRVDSPSNLKSNDATKSSSGLINRLQCIKYRSTGSVCPRSVPRSPGATTSWQQCPP